MRSTRSTAWLLAALLIQATAAAADDVAYAENLVRAVYYEGLPYSEASQVSEAGAARLIEMLRDPAEAPHHGHILAVLGMCGHPGSYEALIEYLEQLRSGELDRSEFRAWRALPGAMGYLARKDPRALAWLIERLRTPGTDLPSFGGHNLTQLQRHAAAYGLGASGQPEARSVLSELANTRSASGRGQDERFARTLEGALELHASVEARAASQGMSR